MSYKGYELCYVNGCSMSAGGGLESPGDLEGINDAYYLKTSLMDHYVKKFNIAPWKTAKDVAYPQRLSELMGIPCINEAQNGSGPIRAIRMTWDFISDNWHIRDKLLILLELPDLHQRLDLYFKPKNEYYIVNLNIDDDWNSNLDWASPSWLTRDQDIVDHQHVFESYMNNHYDYIEEVKRLNRDIQGLYCFCKIHGITIKISLPYQKYKFWKDREYKIFEFGYPEYVDSNDQVNIILPEERILHDDIRVNSISNIWNWSECYKQSIGDEVPEISGDVHPGYFAQINFAKAMKEFLDINLG